MKPLLEDIQVDTQPQQNPDNRHFTEQREEMVVRKARRIPQRYRAIYRAGTSGKSRKKAIRSFCLECCGWNSAEVRICTALDCPLYHYREKG